MNEKKPSEYDSEKRRSIRRSVEPEEMVMSFLVDADDLNVDQVDISDHGIGFTATRPLKIRVRLVWKDKTEDRLADLVWVQRENDSAMRYGFEFLGEAENNPEA